MFCPNCGNRYENEKFCSKCGTKLPAQGQSAQPGSQGQAAPPAGQSAGRNTSYAQQAAPGGYAQQNTQQRPAAGYGAPAGGAGFGQQRPQQPPVYRPQAGGSTVNHVQQGNGQYTAYNQVPGGQAASSQPNHQGAVAGKLKNICAQPVFFVVTVLFTLSVLLNIIFFLVETLQSMLGENEVYIVAYAIMTVIPIIAVIGLWRVYVSGISETSPFSVGGVKMVSGAILAMRIVMWVSAVLLFLFVLLMVFVEDIYYAIQLTLYYMLGIRGGVALTAIVFLVAIAVIIVYNVTGFKYINRFTHSVYIGAQSGRASFMNVHGTKCWLIFLGVIGILSAVGSMWTSFLAGAAALFQALGYFAAYVWINKNFSVVPAPVGAQYQPQGGYRQMPPQYNNYQQAAPQYGYQPPRQSAAQGYQAPRQNMGYQAPQQNTGYQVTGQGAPQQNAGYQAYQQSAPRQDNGYQVSGQSAPQQYTGYQQVQPQEPQQAAPEKPAEKVPAENPSDAAQESEDKD